MEYEHTVRQLGREPTVTFGCTFGPNMNETVGPMNPRHVHYGVTYANDSENVLTNYAFPTLNFGFNKYRPDLPPWDHVKELVLASKSAGTYTEALFIDVEHLSTATTGDLKTVTVCCEGPSEVDGAAFIDRGDI